ncbi:MAG: tRNA pseudouridine(55) synthase TruB [Faecalicatena sp.]|uniref:tRNA pseudouridine(55) synthase TruB n=1 Tax=Faecalicatena sp. TaxID=2005360 RepID=UPI0025882FB7|nr:tRNA pseudouridine(55) synthase TruB [Faecalicatena sp.]MCI6466861.1 tRNA pseudouridine(55) synthase TruB [Faecalicatena sp.]MDY5617569.1 tRNA pseudouridine(55) synthase TruB [Lachnospiraceae bacterium]
MINGVINIYKEKGFTSHDVVAKLRGIVGQKKIGHTGTLDPDAEGVLPVCLGRATKLCDMLTDKDKTYEAVLLFGKTTDTQDISGTVLEEKDTSLLTVEKIEECIRAYIGEYEQVPPMYSALKVNGKKLYELAREGKEVERKARKVQIYDIQIKKIEIPRVTMEVTCSKGTYIRTLCHDIGRDLGTGACMEELLRTRVSRFDFKDSLRLSEIEALKKAGKLMEIVMPVDQMFSDLRALSVDSAHAPLAYNGNPLKARFLHEKTETLPNMEAQESDHQDVPKDGIRVRIYDEDGRFIGIYCYHEKRKEYKLEKMFWDQEELRG